MSIASGDAFPEALKTVHGWLLRTAQPGFLPHELARIQTMHEISRSRIGTA